MSQFQHASEDALDHRKPPYWLVPAVLAGIVATVLISAIPVSAAAFWLFGPFANAEEETDTAIVHDPSIDLPPPAANPDPSPEVRDDLALSDGALIPTGGPDGSVAAGGGVGSSISTYQVREGDSLSGIADMFGVSINTILWANDIKDPKRIKPGDTLVILPVSGIRYTVKNGGTLEDVAKKYGADAGELALFNGIDENATLAAGTEIIIPGGEQTASPGTKPAASSIKPTGGSAIVSSGFFGNPLPGGILTQGIHGTNAVDIGAPAGTPIYAAAAGTVIISKGTGAWNGGYGSYVVISHANGTQTLYAHMSKDVATVGGTVAKGDVIGYVGRTGEATGNHLHFEVRGGTNPFRACVLMKVCSFK